MVLLNLQLKLFRLKLSKFLLNFWNVIFSNVLFAYLPFWFSCTREDFDVVLVQIIQIALCLTALAGDLFSDFPYFLFPLLCFPCFLGSLLSTPFSFNLSQDPISYVLSCSSQSIHIDRKMYKCQLSILSRNHLPRMFIKMAYFSQEIHSSRQKLVLLYKMEWK